MMKRISKIFFIIFCLFFMIGGVSAKSLKQVKDELARDIANRDALIRRKKNVQNNIANAKDDIGDLEDAILKYEDEIESLLNQIDDLNDDIKSKKKEIDNLLAFNQVAEKDNIYLEYIFEAKSLTDFIYRSSIVEELTKYNDEQIENMYNMIEEDKKLQKELQKKIKNSENSIDNLEKKLVSYDVTMSDLEEAHSDIDATIKERKETLAYYTKVYKANNCKETVDLEVCLSIPNSSGFVRPTTRGTITSEWGYRICPIHGRELHSGIDISSKLGTPVYAAASGTVSGITRKSSCGGNIVTINHTVKGKTYRTVYMHLATINVKLGQKVTITTKVGTMGGGGYTLKKNGGWDRCSTGTHLHFTIKKGLTGSTTVNPRTFVKFPAKGKSYTSRW